MFRLRAMHPHRPIAADAPVRAIAPGPAAAEVEDADFIAFLELGERCRLLVGFAKQGRGGDEVADQRVGVMGGDDAAGQRRVGEVLAVCVG